MYALEAKIIEWAKAELKNRLAFLDGWKFKAFPKNLAVAPDMLITANLSGKPYCFCIEAKRAGYPQFIRDAIITLESFRKKRPDCYPIVAVPLMGSRAKAICESKHIGYIDTVGNIKIATGSIIIEKEGVNNPRADFLKNESQSQSMFSSRASRVAKCILNAPRRKWLQKDIVEQTGLSKGMVSRVVRGMLSFGYLAEKKDKLALSNYNDLLLGWAEASAKFKEPAKRFYIWSQNPNKLMHSIAEHLERQNIRYAFTREAGASLRAPFSTYEVVSLYIESFDKFPVKRLSAQEADKGFNVVLFEPRDIAILGRAQKLEGMNVVDDLQLYVDLRKNPLRGQKQAEHLLSVIRKKSL